MGRIGLIDYGAGNFGSVRNALEYLAIDHVTVRKASDFREADRFILPGVGAFAAAMRRIRSLGLDELLHEHVFAADAPYLGICIGMQILATRGREFEVCDGLGVIEGEVFPIDGAAHGVRVPHMGWNSVDPNPNCPLFNGFPENPTFYFVHSYHVAPADPKCVAADCTYGTRIVAGLQKGSIFGVQFHPEKSQHDGLLLLRNFASL